MKKNLVDQVLELISKLAIDGGRSDDEYRKDLEAIASECESRIEYLDSCEREANEAEEDE